MNKTALPVLLALAACAVPGTETPPPSPPSPTASSPLPTVAVEGETPPAAVAEGNRRFAIALYRRLASEEEGNIFFSPLSLGTAFGLVIAGAEGETRDGIAGVMHYPVSGEGLHPAIATLSRDLLRDGTNGSPTLTIANALWANEGFRINPSFLATARDRYGAPVEQLDFEDDPEGAAARINGWANRQTRGRIPRIVAADNFDETTRLVVTNAVYFLADWDAPFSANATAPAPFRLENGQLAEVPMMNRRGGYRVHDGGTFDAIDLPYRDEALVMTILLPKQANGLPSLEQRVDAGLLGETFASLDTAEPTPGTVQLPKFEFRTSYDLGATLAAMGMARAFSDQAEFGGITREEQLAIDQVFHKAFVRVDERGTEAAAVTSIEMVAVSAPQPPQFTFRADHPFIVAIRDRASGAVLFYGRVMRPEGA